MILNTNNKFKEDQCQIGADFKEISLASNMKSTKKNKLCGAVCFHFSSCLCIKRLKHLEKV